MVGGFFTIATDSIMNSKLLCPLLFVIVSLLVKPFNFISLSPVSSVFVDSVFLLGSRENYSHFEIHNTVYTQNDLDLAEHDRFYSKYVWRIFDK
jgi:hypothetical protein